MCATDAHFLLRPLTSETTLIVLQLTQQCLLPLESERIFARRLKPLFKVGSHVFVKMSMQFAIFVGNILGPRLCVSDGITLLSTSVAAEAQQPVVQ